MKTIIITFAALLTFQFSLYANCEFETSIIIEETPVGNLLEWSTSKEQDSDKFIIEKSLDGEMYKSIGEVNAAGHSNEKLDYQFLDLNAQKGITYYRLKYVDTKGNESYSAPATIDKEQHKAFFIQDAVQADDTNSWEMTIDFPEAAELSCSILDANDNIIQTSTQAYPAGVTTLSINFEGYSDEMYKINLVSGNDKELIVVLRNSEPTAPLAQQD